MSEKKNTWRKRNKTPSLPEVFSSIPIPYKKGIWKKLLAFTGPGLLIAVGYMDPGNWATDITGGSYFGYKLLSVIFISNIFAIILQYLSIKLGIVCERDLAQACRDHYHPSINFILWILCEIAISSCDLAEIIGSVLALKLLLGVPILWGIFITILDVFLILIFQSNKRFRYIEIFVLFLILTIVICFSFEIFMSKPKIYSILKGIIPDIQIINNPHAFYISIGILGATVMPHNLYLHSSLVQTRDYPRTIQGKKMAIKYATIDIILSLFLAFLINSSILIISASTFYKNGHKVVNLMEAHKLLSPILGSSLSSLFFAIALLASGQNSTLTGTLAGQIVMEGFLNIQLKPWIRRLITRSIAIIPAVIIFIFYGEKWTVNLLIISQIILSIQLIFAIIPLVHFTGNYKKMGPFVNGIIIKILSWLTAIIIIILNILLSYQIIKNHVY